MHTSHMILENLVAEVLYARSFGEPGIELRSWINLGKKYGLASSQQDMNNHDGKNVSTVTRFQADPLGKKHAKDVVISCNIDRHEYWLVLPCPALLYVAISDEAKFGVVLIYLPCERDVSRGPAPMAQSLCARTISDNFQG